MNGTAATRPRTAEEPGVISARLGGFPQAPYTLRGHRRTEVWFGGELIIKLPEGPAALHLVKQLNRAFNRGAQEALVHFNVKPVEDAPARSNAPLAILGPGGDFTHPVGGRLDIHG